MPLYRLNLLNNLNLQSWYKLTMLFFFLTVYSSQSLTDNYKITFENENASYLLNINNGGLVFENNQPNVTITAIDDNNAADSAQEQPFDSTQEQPFDSTQEQPFDSTQGKIYKITKGATFEDGLKIGADDNIDVEGKIGEEDDIDIEKEINPLLSDVKDHQAYAIILSSISS